MPGGRVMLRFLGVFRFAAILAFLLLPSAIPTATAADAGGGPHVQDHGTYERTRVGGDGHALDAPRTLLTFAWGINLRARASSGEEHPVHTLFLAAPGSPDRRWAVAADGTVLSQTVTSHESSPVLSELLDELPYTPKERLHLSVTTFGPPSASKDVLERDLTCLITVAPSKRWDRCIADLAPQGRAEIGGHKAQRWSTPDGRVHVWIGIEVGHPLRLATAGGDGTYDVATLARFDPGRQPLPPLDESIRPAPRAVTWAPRTAWGLDGRGVSHPFPLSRAYEIAYGAKGAGLTESASYEEVEVDGVQTWSWVISTLESGRREAVRVSHVQFPGSLLDHKLPAMRVWNGPPFDSVEPCCASQDPIPATGPTEMPTVRSLAWGWEAFASTYRAPSTHRTWGFQTSCLPETCEQTTTRYWIGHTDPAVAPAESLHLPAQRRTALLVFDDSGSPLAFIDERQTPVSMGEASSSYVPNGATPPLVASHTPIEPTVLAGTLTAIGLAVLAWALWKMFAGGTSLFSLLRPDRVLAHPTRKLIFDAIQTEPGVHQEALQERLHLSRGALRHHLTQLMRVGHVVQASGTRFTCYAPARGVDRRLVQAAPMLKAHGARTVLEAVLAAPDSLRGTGRRTGLTRQTVSYHVRRLERVGLVESIDGLVVPTAQGRELAKAWTTHARAI